MAAVKNETLKRLPVKHILVGLDDILYSLVNRVQIPVGDDDLDFTSARVLPESVTTGTDGYFQDPVLRPVKTGHFAIYPDEGVLG